MTEFHPHLLFAAIVNDMAKNNAAILGSCYYLEASIMRDFVYIKFITHNFKVLNHYHVCNS
jgi:hypothetical protein